MATIFLGENVNKFFFRLASVLFNDAVKKELEVDKNLNCKQQLRSIGSNQLVNETIRLSVNKNEFRVFDFMIERKCC